MKSSMKTITVLLIDGNKYFLDGLRYVIDDVHRHENIVVNYIYQPISGLSVDIVFQAICYGVTVDVRRYLQPGIPPPLMFFIRDKRDPRLSHVFQGVRKNGTLYRHQSIDDVRNMLEAAMFMRRFQLPRGDYTVAEPLTYRESEVLRYLRQGRSPTDTARVMKLQVKTVSSHKRSAMRKLNFKRNHELFHWMLQGGLTRSAKEI